MSEILINIKIANSKKSFGIFGNLNLVQIISEHAQMSEIKNFRTPQKSMIFIESLEKFARANIISNYKGDF